MELKYSLDAAKLPAGHRGRRGLNFLIFLTLAGLLALLLMALVVPVVALVPVIAVKRGLERVTQTTITYVCPTRFRL